MLITLDTLFLQQFYYTMRIIKDINTADIKEDTIVTIGTFDGVHLGHLKILNRLKELKKTHSTKSVVLTFDPHPRKIVFPEQNDLKLLSLLAEKNELLDLAGVDYVVIFEFTQAFSQIEPEKFIKEVLAEKLNVKTLVIGYDHKFGKNRSGDINTFKLFGKELNYKVEEIQAKDINNINISSSKIRKALEEGDVELAASFLGYNYFLSGQVIHGKKLGKTIGYPTANIAIESSDKLIPKPGVYFVEVITTGFKGYGMLNIGTNPTTDNDSLIKIEVNIFNFDEDIYNKKIKIAFLKRIRDEQKFNSIDELKKALKNDELICKSLIK